MPSDLPVTSRLSTRVVGLVLPVQFHAPRDPVVLPRELIVLPQRVALPVLGAQDPPQVWVTGKVDSEQVERLALVPIRRRPEVGDARDARVLARRVDLQREAVPVL